MARDKQTWQAALFTADPGYAAQPEPELGHIQIHAVAFRLRSLVVIRRTWRSSNDSRLFHDRNTWPKDIPS